MNASKDADALVDLSAAPIASTISDGGPIDDARLQKVYSKISSRVLPLLMIVMILNHVGKCLMVACARWG